MSLHYPNKDRENVRLKNMIFFSYIYIEILYKGVRFTAIIYRFLTWDPSSLFVIRLSLG